jgi:hypothetical protein
VILGRSVGKVNDYELEGWNSIPDREKYFFFFVVSRRVLEPTESRIALTQ